MPLLIQNRLFLLAALISGLAGCAWGDKESILPQQGPTMKEVYDHHFQGSPPLNSHPETGEKTSDNPTIPAEQTMDTHRKTIQKNMLRPNDLDLVGYTREAHTELSSRFQRLPNPTLVLYVFPHLAGEEQNPVPGYSTLFSLYTKVHYALPGELAN